MQTELVPVLSALAKREPLEVIFVDDGSQDGTARELQKEFAQSDLPGVAYRFERHDQNRGLGAALRTGFSAASGDIVVTTDSDGTYSFTLIPDLIACLKDGVSIVTASPYHPEGSVVGVPAYRLALSRGSSLIYRLLVDWKVHTYTCLFRAYRRPVIRQFPIEADGFLAGTELMVKAMLAGCRVSEYPAVLRRREFGVSKARLLQTILAHLRFQARVLLHRLHLIDLFKERSL
jgi:dolichol-phosphate mannosyltransferase